MTNFIFPRSHLAGLTLSTAGGSATFGVAVGQCADSTNAMISNLATPMTKTTAGFAAGSGNGALDSGSISANTLYYAHLIDNQASPGPDIVASLSSVAPTLPAGFATFRCIGALYTDASSHWSPFSQIGDRFEKVTGSLDFNGTVGTSRSLITLNCPPNTIALLRAFMTNITANVAVAMVPTSETDAAPSNSAVPLQNLFNVTASGGNSGQYEIRVDASSQIAARSSGSASTLRVLCYGWIDRRGRDN